MADSRTAGQPDRARATRGPRPFARSAPIISRHRARLSNRSGHDVGDAPLPDRRSRDSVRAALPPGWTAAKTKQSRAGRKFEPTGCWTIPRSWRCRAPADEGHRRLGRARSGRRDARTIRAVSNDDGAVSAAAMALILAGGRRRDRFGQCLCCSTTPLELARTTLNIICAGLRVELEAVHGAGAVDSACYPPAAQFITR